MNEIRNIYFIGIGGIGMSALARYFKATGAIVSGYDKTPTPLTGKLAQEGISVHFNDDPSLIPQNIELAVYTPAIPKDHRELNYLRQKGCRVIKRSEMLGLLSKDHFSIAIGGTHGKTTITSLVAHLLQANNLRPTAFIGGISLNFNSNLCLNVPPGLMVIEADEYDRSFLQLFPGIAVISSMDPDHLDIYGTREKLHASFNAFASNVSKGGLVVVKKGLPLSIPEGVRSMTYSVNGPADCFASDIRIENGQLTFSVSIGEKSIDGLSVFVPGRHNIENMLAACCVATEMGIGPDGIRRALESYRGVYRRFEYRIREENLVFIDDYAHHPGELDSIISAVKEIYQDKKVTGIFQPHLFSRTRDFAAEFAASLDALDQVYLLDIYPAREEPIEGVSSAMLLSLLKNPNKKLLGKEEMLEELRLKRPQVLVTLGAGDIDQLVPKIEKVLRESLTANYSSSNSLIIK